MKRNLESLFSSRVYGPAHDLESFTLRKAAFAASHYRYARRTLRRGAADAWRYALRQPLAYVPGKESYGLLTGNAGARFDRSGDVLRWIASTKAAGLRFVGYADELAGLRHKGWFTYPDGENGETLRGAVWQLPGRKGKARLIYGYEEWEGRGEMNPGSACLCVSDIRETDMRADEWGSLSEHDETRDAARAADSLAEHEAESSRDYNQAYQEGRDAGEADGEALAARREALALVRDMKARFIRIERQGPVWDTLARSLSAALDMIRDKRKARDNSWQSCPSWDEEAWRAGFMDESSFVRAVRLGFAKREHWRGAADANPLDREAGQ